MSEKRKMKLASYLTIALTTIFLFSLAWILTSLSNSFSTIWGIVMAFVFVVLIIQLFSISIKMTVSSIKRLTSFKQEKSLWKMLTLIFGICLVVFAIIISILSLIWIIYVVKDALIHFDNGFDAWINNVIYYAQLYIGGSVKVSVGGNELVLAQYGLFVSIFVLILIWSAGGIAYEILKKILGGNRVKQQHQN